ncbi:hypothetical protein B0G77_0029 [Paraburkholderia sp. BL10I2N1]|nr:hypothetical protein B0G77_0029 [Paraburkholderia sp. BL10I2N1]
MASLVARWRFQTDAVTEIAGFQKWHVFGSVLLTKRWERFINEGAVVTNSRIAKNAEALD